MARRPAPPSSVSPSGSAPAGSSPGRRPRDRPTPPRDRVDARAWLGGIRLSGFMVVMMGLVVLAAFVLVPTFSTYVQQRQRIAALERQVEVTAAQVAELKAQRERWRDPAYITAQARERLYYVHPGEVVYLIDNDLDAAHQPTAEAPVSAEVTTTRSDWMTQLLSSVVSAGTAQTVGGAE